MSAKSGISAHPPLLDVREGLRGCDRAREHRPVTGRHLKQLPLRTGERGEQRMPPLDQRPHLAERERAAHQGLGQPRRGPGRLRDRARRMRGGPRGDTPLDLLAEPLVARAERAVLLPGGERVRRAARDARLDERPPLRPVRVERRRVPSSAATREARQEGVPLPRARPPGRLGPDSRRARPAAAGARTRRAPRRAARVRRPVADPAARHTVTSSPAGAVRGDATRWRA